MEMDSTQESWVLPKGSSNPEYKEYPNPNLPMNKRFAMEEKEEENRFKELVQ